MRIDFALLLIVAGVGLMDPTIVRGTEPLQESVRSDGIAIPQNAISEPLDQILRKHEAQLARLVTLQSDWSVTYQNSAEDPARIEHWQTTIAPDYERSKRLAPGSEIPDHYLWDGSSFRQMLGYDSEEYSREPASIAAVDGLLYREDSPIHRLFQWRTLQAYRLYVNEGDQSLRELCEQSLREPKFSRTDGLAQIQLVHPGSSASSYSGTREIPRGASILFEVDPSKGYLVRRHRTTFPLNSDGGHEWHCWILSHMEARTCDFFRSSVVWLLLSIALTFAQQPHQIRPGATSASLKPIEFSSPLKKVQLPESPYK